MERRVLYNSLRLHFQDDPDLDVEPWQVADYRHESVGSLIQQLGSFEIYLDPSSFVAYADSCESPEQLTDELLSDAKLEPEEADYIYLLIFELWRRLLPEKQTTTLFCDELDHQISHFDPDKLKSLEPLEDALANLQYLLNEEVDKGADPRELFENIKDSCANSIEDFLYDFIHFQIENNNHIFASEVLEGFNDYVDDPKWLALLKARLLVTTDPEEASLLVDNLLELTAEEQDIDFQIEFLTLLVQEGERDSFCRIVQTILDLLETEDELQDLLSLCEDYFHCLDDEENEEKIQAISSEREDIDLEESINPKDSHIAQLKSLFIPNSKNNTTN